MESSRFVHKSTSFWRVTNRPKGIVAWLTRTRQERASREPPSWTPVKAKPKAGLAVNSKFYRLSWVLYLGCGYTCVLVLQRNAGKFVTCLLPWCESVFFAKNKIWKRGVCKQSRTATWLSVECYDETSRITK